MIQIDNDKIIIIIEIIIIIIIIMIMEIIIIIVKIVITIIVIIFFFSFCQPPRVMSWLYRTYELTLIKCGANSQKWIFLTKNRTAGGDNNRRSVAETTRRNVQRNRAEERRSIDIGGQKAGDEVRLRA